MSIQEMINAYEMYSKERDAHYIGFQFNIEEEITLYRHYEKLANTYEKYLETFF